MKYPATLLGVGLSVLLLGCSTPVPAVTPAGQASPLESPPPIQTQVGQGQFLPVTAQATMVGKVIQLEVALTPEQQQLGLMYRPPLPNNRGMLFPFHPPQPVSFWMKNVAVSLDMVFLNQGVVQKIARNVPPCTQEPCALYGPPVAVDQVIELRAGLAEELGLKEGDQVPVQFIKPGDSAN